MLALKVLDGEAQRRSKGVALCLCELGESIRQGVQGGAAVLYDQVRSDREVCKSGSGQCDSSGGLQLE